MISPYETDRRTSAPATPNRQAAKERQETPPPPPQAEPEAITRDAPIVTSTWLFNGEFTKIFVGKMCHESKWGDFYVTSVGLIELSIV